MNKTRPDLSELNKKLKTGKKLSEEHRMKIIEINKNRKRNEKGQFIE